MMSSPNPDGRPEAGFQSSQTPAEREEERRKLRRLQLMIDTTLSILRQASNLTPEEAAGIVSNCRSAALAMFPDKEFTFDLIYKPRLERVLAERFQESGDRV